MRAGEKILYHRRRVGLTQKKLAELSGVSEISIRKYELGSRNPKPEQLKKLAKAMGLGENELLEIEIAEISLQTVGDFMAIVYQFAEKMDSYLVSDCDHNGNMLKETMNIRFHNPQICEALYLVAEHFAEIGQARSDFIATNPTREQEVSYYLEEQHLIAMQKKAFVSCDIPLFEPNAPVNKPMPDFEKLLSPESED
ncbi:MAG: helix-turn-helix transcriptional regulator [Eubacteriales bacterium]